MLISIEVVVILYHASTLLSVAFKYLLYLYFSIPGFHFHNKYAVVDCNNRYENNLLQISNVQG